MGNGLQPLEAVDDTWISPHEASVYAVFGDTHVLQPSNRRIVRVKSQRQK